MDNMGDSFNFLRNPKWQIVFAILGGLLIYIALTYWLGGAWENFWSIIIDLVLFYGGIVFWMFFFAQFTLPVKETRNRRLVFERLWSYLFGQHGAAIFIENGEIRKHAGELDTDLPGIAVLDTASAAVLRTDVEYTRAVGPGVIFNEYNANSGLLEHIRDGGTVDLHGQSQFFGPREDENPFEEKSEDEISATSSERKKRRWQTRGLTRNGIEIVPNVLVTFQLDSTPGEGHTQFGYNEAAVFKALTRGGIDPDVGVDSLHKNVPWNELPCYVAVDIWRELIAMFTLDELFQELPADFMAPGSTDKTRQGSRKPMTGLDFINAYLRQRLTQPEVDLLDNYGHVTGNKIPSQEFRQFKDRGIKVSFAFVVNLRFQESVEEELISRWKLTWEQKALDEKFKIEKEVNDCKARGQTRAMHDYSREVSLSLSRLSPGIAHDSTKILTGLAEGSLSLIVRKPALNNVMNDEKLILLDLITWLQKRP
jgi:hypothetical protein